MALPPLPSGVNTFMQGQAAVCSLCPVYPELLAIVLLCSQAKTKNKNKNKKQKTPSEKQIFTFFLLGKKSIKTVTFYINCSTEYTNIKVRLLQLEEIGKESKRKREVSGYSF